MKKERFLMCIAERLTPKMRNSLKLKATKPEVENLKTYCREKHLDFDVIPITAVNFGRLAVVLNQVKSINYNTLKQ